MSHARAEDGTVIDLLPDTDNWPLLQALCDAHTSVYIPPGTWPLTQPLNLRTGFYLQGAGVEQTTIIRKGTFGGPIIGLGGEGRWPGSGAYGQANGVVVRGLELFQTDTQGGTNPFFNNDGNNLLVQNVRVRGCSYEGLISGSNCQYVTLRDVEAWDCGNGGPAYSQSTAGLNATSVDLLIDGFKILRCGQGIETGNTRVTVQNGYIGQPGVGAPSLGVNIGSTGYGVYQVTVQNVVLDQMGTGIEVGNGIGRLCAVTIQNNTVYTPATNGVGIEFAGGIATNSVHTPNEGPDTQGSFILNNTIHVLNPMNGAIGYNTGTVNNGGVLGREPLTIAGNAILFQLPDPTLQGAPAIYFAGMILASVKCRQNTIDGLPNAPPRGDLASFTLISNPAVPGFPTLDNRSLITTYNAKDRPTSIKIE